MVRCERASLILFIRYLQNRIARECRDRDIECSLRVLEEVKVQVEELAADDVEREIFS